MAGFSLRNLFRRRSRGRKTIQNERRRNRRHRPDPDCRVLVVDDSRTVRHTIRKMLEEGGYGIIEAADGKEAVELARSERPCLVFMDVVMPELNGFQATRRLRRSEETADLPIIIMSGDREATQQFWGMRIGASDYMVKPFTRLDLYKRVERVLYNNEISAA